MTKLIRWDIYEVQTSQSNIQGVMFRGRVRKFGLMNDLNVLVENDALEPTIVRYAIETNSDSTAMQTYIESIIPGAKITGVLTSVANPVLSKLKVNDEHRYTL